MVNAVLSNLKAGECLSLGALHFSTLCFKSLYYINNGLEMFIAGTGLANDHTF